MKVSASRLNTWMTCPRQAHLQYDLNLPRRQSAKATWGSVLHAALKGYFDRYGDIEWAMDFFKSRWAKPHLMGLTPDYWPKMTSYGSLKNKGVEILDRLHAQALYRTWTVVGTEVPFHVPFGDHSLNGIIDMITIETSGTGKKLLKIIDWKGAGKDPTQAELALNPQLTVYAFAVQQRELWVGDPSTPDNPGVANGEWLWETVGKMLPHRVIWYSLWNGKELDAGPRDQKDFERLYRVVNEIDRSQKAGIYIPRIGDACTYCDFTEDCGLEIPVAIAQASNPNDPNRWI